MNKVSSESSGRRQDRCLGGKMHLNSAMKLLILIGTMVTIALLAVLFFKFRKAMFVLIIPTSVIVITVFAILFKKHNCMWPIIAISMFHIMLASYLMLIFAFFFVFKPLYIIMVLNWAFKTLHSEKTLSYYLQCGGIAAFLVGFTAFNVWQAIIGYSYRSMIKKQEDSRIQKPTVLVVNKQAMY